MLYHWGLRVQQDLELLVRFLPLLIYVLILT